MLSTVRHVYTEWLSRTWPVFNEISRSGGKECGQGLCNDSMKYQGDQECKALTLILIKREIYVKFITHKMNTSYLSDFQHSNDQAAPKIRPHDVPKPITGADNDLAQPDPRCSPAHETRRFQSKTTHRGFPFALKAPRIAARHSTGKDRLFHYNNITF